jgi:hypothetical protein
MEVIYKRCTKNPNYFISDTGEIYSLTEGIFRKKIIRKDRYLQVRVPENGHTKNFLIHRLVAEAFLGKSDLEVNHKDLDRSNNNLSNLEYLTKNENLYHRSFGKRRFVSALKCGRFKVQINTPAGRKRYGVLFHCKDKAYEFARQEYKKHFGVYPWN